MLPPNYPPIRPYVAPLYPRRTHTPTPLYVLTVLKSQLLHSGWAHVSQVAVIPEGISVFSLHLQHTMTWTRREGVLEVLVDGVVVLLDCILVECCMGWVDGLWWMVGEWLLVGC